MLYPGIILDFSDIEWTSSDNDMYPFGRGLFPLSSLDLEQLIFGGVVFCPCNFVGNIFGTSFGLRTTWLEWILMLQRCPTTVVRPFTFWPTTYWRTSLAFLLVPITNLRIRPPEMKQFLLIWPWKKAKDCLISNWLPWRWWRVWSPNGPLSLAILIVWRPSIVISWSSGQRWIGQTESPGSLNFSGWSCAHVVVSNTN